MPLLPAYKSLFMVRVEPVFILIYEPHHAGEVILYVRLSKVVLPSIFTKKWAFPTYRCRWRVLFYVYNNISRSKACIDR